MEDIITEAETYDVVMTYDEWKDQTSHRNSQFADIDPGVYADVELVKRAAKYFQGFMLKPVALIEGRVLECKSRVFNDLQELETDVYAGNKYLYTIDYHPSRPRYYQITDNEVSLLDSPIFTKGYWMIRYAIDGGKND